MEFPAAAVEPMTEHALRAKAAWARLIRKVYEAGPREWPVMAGLCLSLVGQQFPRSEHCLSDGVATTTLNGLR